MSPLFNNNKKTTIAELEEYYANQRNNDGTIRAWAMAILSLLITVAVILALFFAGRWAWRALTDNDDKAATTTSQSEGVIVQEDGSLSGDLSLLNSGTVTVDTGSVTEGVVSTEAASTDESNSDSVSVSVEANEQTTASASDDTASVSTTGSTTATELPNTGANIFALPIIAGVAGYLASTKRKIASLKS